MPFALSPPSHYAILSLGEPSPSSNPPSPAEVKIAYKRALLVHHPDKISTDKVRSHPPASVPTVDQITIAYKTLSNPPSQRVYTANLLASRRPNPLTLPPRCEGFEVVDLDSMQYDSRNQAYYRACRCGREKGYLLRETELEERAEDAEVDVGCEGCSLWIKVEFGVIEET